MKRRAPSAGSGFASPFHGSRARTPEPIEQCSLIGVLEALGSHQCALREKRPDWQICQSAGAAPRPAAPDIALLVERGGQRQQPRRAGAGRRQGSLVCPGKTDEKPFPIPQIDRNRRQGSWKGSCKRSWMGSGWIPGRNERSGAPGARSRSGSEARRESSGGLSTPGEPPPGTRISRIRVRTGQNQNRAESEPGESEPGESEPGRI